jgi:hypothetical protein
MSTYIFGAADQSLVVRDGIAWIPWDLARQQPASGGHAFDLWIADGSPVPSPYISAVSTATVDAFAASRLRAGFADATTGKTWQCDDASLIKWVGIGASAAIAVLANTTPVPNFPLIAADNSTITLTAPQAFALFNQRLMPWISATVFFARTMKNNILANNPPADITVGWP